MDWKELFDRLGLNGTRWQWRIYRWQQRWAARGNQEQTAGAAGKKTYQHKFCHHCGAIVAREDSTCSRCGKSVGSWRTQRIRRYVTLMSPGWISATTVLILVNAVYFLFPCMQEGVKAVFNPSSESLVYLGALFPPFVLEGQWWRLITYGFLHGGLIHLAFNLFALSQVGPALEQEIGRSRFYVLYFMSLLGGSVADMIIRGTLPYVIIGASGALFGLIGFGAVYHHKCGANVQRNFFLQWALYGFIFGFFIGADNVAHLGGFLAGAVFGWVLPAPRLLRGEKGTVWPVAATVCALVTAACLLLAGFAWFQTVSAF